MWPDRNKQLVDCIDYPSTYPDTFERVRVDFSCTDISFAVRALLAAARSDRQLPRGDERVSSAWGVDTPLVLDRDERDRSVTVTVSPRICCLLLLLLHEVEIQRQWRRDETLDC